MTHAREIDSQLADAFKALGHPVRLALLRHMLAEEPCVGELQEAVGQSQSSVSQHLGILRDRGIIVPQRDGNRTCYRVADDRLAELLSMAEQVLES
ncbi:MAG: metalloregulator ArsR/SmtB family transcription factor [Armatimonadota bacterium]